MTGESGNGMFDEVYPCTGPYKVGVARTMESFMAMGGVWDRLAAEHGLHEPFLRHDWFRIWLGHFQGPSDLFIATVIKDEAPALIAPLLTRRERYKKIASVVKIQFMGNHHSPVSSFIFGDSHPSEKLESLRRLFCFLKESYRRWDVMELDAVPEEGDAAATLERALEESGISFVRQLAYNDWLLEDIGYSGEEYLNGRTKNLKKELRRRARRLEEEGNVSFVTGNRVEELEKYLGIYQEVRRKSWKHDEADAAFLMDFREWAMEKGWLRFAFLNVDDSPVSAHIRLVSNNKAYLMESVYDAAYREFSPTTLLRSLLMKYIIDNEDVRTIDTIRGDEPYKADWTPVKRRRICFSAFNNSARGQLFRFLLKVAAPAARKIRTLSGHGRAGRQGVEP